MATISANLQAVRARVGAAARRAERDVESIELLAVSKTFPAAAVREAAAAGQRAFGENYVQEAIAKMAELTDLDLEWHFIGPIQGNKTRPIAEHFAWVHSVDRLRIARRLADSCGARSTPLQVCVQVNVSGAQSKSGIAPTHLPELAEAIAALPGLRLRGLMTIAEATDDFALQRSRFACLRQLKDQLEARGLILDTLSMGMSHDLEAAIIEGATIVRVGTAVFGQRART